MDRGCEVVWLHYADWAGSPSEQKSKLSGIFIVSYAVVSSYNRKQISVAPNSTKAEYMDTSQETCEAI